MAVAVLETEVHREEQEAEVDTRVVREPMDWEVVVAPVVSTTSTLEVDSVALV
jgi:hypothetical protein